MDFCDFVTQMSCFTANQSLQFLLLLRIKLNERKRKNHREIKSVARRKIHFGNCYPSGSSGTTLNTGLIPVAQQILRSLTNNDLLR